MRFLLDENIGKQVADFLEESGHTCLRVRTLNPGIEDFQVLDLAISKAAILITSDKDFGELIFKEKYPFTGIVFLRLQDQSSQNIIKC